MSILRANIWFLRSIVESEVTVSTDTSQLDGALDATVTSVNIKNYVLKQKQRHVVY